jgi:hypothetical protein
VPVAFFVGAGLALGQEAGFGLREQVRAIPAVLLGSAPLGSRTEEPSKVQQSHGEGLSDERSVRPRRAFPNNDASARAKRSAHARLKDAPHEFRTVAPQPTRAALERSTASGKRGKVVLRIAHD